MYPVIRGSAAICAAVKEEGAYSCWPVKEDGKKKDSTRVGGNTARRKRAPNQKYLMSQMLFLQV